MKKLLLIAALVLFAGTAFAASYPHQIFVMNTSSGVSTVSSLPDAVTKRVMVGTHGDGRVDITWDGSDPRGRGYSLGSGYSSGIVLPPDAVLRMKMCSPEAVGTGATLFVAPID
jgi:hypothetical protein